MNDLKLTVASVECQNYSNLHYVVVDGASSDGTKSFLEDCHNIVDRWVSEPDGGIYDAMNKAIDLCPPDSWVLFLNAGDRLASNDVLQRISGCLTDSVDFVFGDVAVRHANGVRVYRSRPKTLVEMPGCHQSTLVRASLLKRHYFDKSYRVAADFEFFLRATEASRRLGIFRGVIAEVAPEGFTAQNEALLRRDYVALLAKYRGNLTATRWLTRRVMGTAFRRFIAMVKA